MLGQLLIGLFFRSTVESEVLQDVVEVTQEDVPVLFLVIEFKSIYKVC